MQFNINMQDKKIFIFTIVVFLFGVFNGFYNMYSCRRVHMASVIIGFLPITILIIRNTIAQGNLKYYRVVTPTLVGIFIAIIFFNFYATKIMDLSGANSNIVDYKRILRIDNYPSNKYIEHFPNEIPLNTKNHKFKEWTGFVYGSIGLYLSYTLDNEQIKEIEKSEKVKEAKEIIGTLDELNRYKEIAQIPNGVIEVLEIREGTRFKIYILGSSPMEDWEHGYSYGIGINYDTDTILYFGEKW